MKHVKHECDEVECMVCDGGLFVCTVCGGAEGALTTECCGRRMSGAEINDVFNGKKNFIFGRWME